MPPMDGMTAVVPARRGLLPVALTFTIGAWARTPDAAEDSVANLLDEWRAAERHTAAANGAARVAALALIAAEAAEEASLEAATAGDAAHESAGQAQRLPIRRAGPPPRLPRHHRWHPPPQGDTARADQAVSNAESAEDAARRRFHDADGE